jgi:hypothetical protein
VRPINSNGTPRKNGRGGLCASPKRGKSPAGRASLLKGCRGYSRVLTAGHVGCWGYSQGTHGVLTGPTEGVSAHTSVVRGYWGTAGVLGSTGGYRGFYGDCKGYSRVPEVLNGRSGYYGYSLAGCEGGGWGAHMSVVCWKSCQPRPTSLSPLQEYSGYPRVDNGTLTVYSRRTHGVLKRYSEAYSQGTHRGTRGCAVLGDIVPEGSS